MSKKIILLAGPTASGKSKLANGLAKKLNGEIIVMTGFRDKNLNAMIKDLGGEVGDNINKKTTIVLAKDISSGSSKIAKAQKLGIKVTERIPILINPNKYNKKYLETKHKKSGHIF